MPETFGFETYISPFTKRYGSKEMREIHSDLNTAYMWRQVWTALAGAQAYYGLLTSDEARDIKAHGGHGYVEAAMDRARQLDRKIRHDLMAHVKAYAEQCKIGGGKLHLGGTSMDIEDNVDIKKSRQSADILITRFINTLDSMRPHIETHTDTPCVAWTHLQPAGYTTVGYRFANYAQQLMLALDHLEYVRDNHLKGKGMKGIAGTSTSYTELLDDPAKAAEMEKFVMDELGLEAFPVATQVYPRIVDYIALSALAALAVASSKFALDLRLFSSPVLGELYKIPAPDKVGSSAAPWKIFNPTEAERMNSLSRYVAALPGIAWDNAASDIFERTLDDSANRRITLAEGYLATDQIGVEYDNILRNLGIREPVMKKNLRNYGTFMKTEPLMMEGVKRGANRQKFHEAVRRHVMEAYELMLAKGVNPLAEMLSKDEYVSQFFRPEEIDNSLSVNTDLDKELGDAPLRTRRFLERKLYPVLEAHKERLGVHVDPEF